MWLFSAMFSAFFAGITSILVKCGIKKTDSDLATAIRTIVVLGFSCLMVLISNSANTITQIQTKSIVFLILSGLATGASWLCYFKALSLGDVNKVTPVDKSSTVLTVLLAIICFGETDRLVLKLAGSLILAAGIFLMIEKKNTSAKSRDRLWLLYAVLSAVFAALTSILAKIGISGVESNLGTAIRTFVVLIMSWVIVFTRKKQIYIKSIDKKELLFILFSGVSTGASWLCYYYALQKGVVSAVVAIDKMSIVVTVFFSTVFLKERLSKKAVLGLCLMILGTSLISLI